MKKYIAPTQRVVELTPARIMVGSDPDSVTGEQGDEAEYSNTDFGWGFDDEDKSWKW